MQIKLNNPAIRTFGDAIDAAMRRCKNLTWQRAKQKGNWKRRDEPTWHQPKTVIDCCDEIGCSNYTEILNAFSIETEVFNHLPTFRNFYAHRNDQTAIATQEIAQNYSIPLPSHPTEILLTPAHDRPQILILDWIDDMAAVVELLCE